jgi:hypothetical protein
LWCQLLRSEYGITVDNKKCSVCNTSRVPEVLLRGNSRNVNIFLSIFLAPKLIRPDHPTRRPVVEYHRRNIISKPKNICLYSVIYIN